jgi:predicted alpha/beta hydrolase family esterase
MRRPAYLILHGYLGSGPGHWQTWLAGRLRSGEASVYYPDLPDADSPQLRSWLEALEGELDSIAEPPVVICHSLACLLWLHHAAAGGKPASRVLLAAPPSQAGAPDVLASFFPVVLDGAALAASAPEGVRIVASDDDPYCPEGAAALYGEPLGLPTDVLDGCGHLNPEAGYGPWLAVEAWAREGTVPITE